MNSPSINEEYLRKLVSADDAVKLVNSGDRVYIGSNCGQPVEVLNALAKRHNELHGIEIVHILLMGAAPTANPLYSENFRHLAYFMGASIRKPVNEGYADYAPIFLSEIPQLFYSGQTPVDVAVVAVSPPDEHGYCSMGISVDIGLAACQTAKVIIAEINEQMPRTMGPGMLHVRDVTAFVRTNYPVLEHAPGDIDDISRAIARHIVNLIPDGATIQTGIGNIPDAVLDGLKDKNDLGVHTEMFADGLIPLIESGVVTCRKKTLRPGKVICTFVNGTRKLYDYIDNNPFFEFHTSDYVNDPFVVAQNNDMIAINGAIEVDLTGQIVSDSIGTRFYSGIGGQVDFIRGAARSKGGKPIIALPSRTNKGVSRIVPMVKPGAGVVTSRGDAHYVATEYGIAYLHGKSVRERALALIRIAHPDVRDELMEKAKELGYIPKDQPTLTHVYPDHCAKRVTIKTGETIAVRPVMPTDEDAVKRYFYSLKPESVERRFNRMVRMLSNETVRDMVNVDYKTRNAFVATISRGNGEQILGSARFQLDESTNVAEIAFAVLDDWQNRGIGRALVDALVASAKELKIKAFEGYVGTDNASMLRLLQSCGCPCELKLEGNQYKARLTFEQAR